MTLEEIRTKLDDIDKTLKDSFVLRMKCSEQIAEIKADSNDSIYKPDRETLIISRNSADVDEPIRKEYREFLKTIIGLSRKYQYEKINEIKCPKFLNDIINSLFTDDNSKKDVNIRFKCDDTFDAFSAAIAMVHNYDCVINDFSCEHLDEGKYIISFKTYIDRNNTENLAMLYQLSEETTDFEIY